MSATTNVLAHLQDYIMRLGVAKQYLVQNQKTELVALLSALSSELSTDSTLANNTTNVNTLQS